jgi:hypothetical protein
MDTCEGEPCGAPGQDCCEGMGGGGVFFACSGGAGCVDGTCDLCGAEGQACCDNGCDDMLVCGDNDRCEQPPTPDGGTGGTGGPGAFFASCDEVGEDCCTFTFGPPGGGGGGMSFCGNMLTCSGGTCE